MRRVKITRKPPRLYVENAEYFLTFRTYQWKVILELADRKMILEGVKFLSNKMGFDLFAAVVLPNHVHILAKFNKGKEVTSFLKRLKSHTSKRVKARQHLTTPVWQRGTYDRVVRSDKQFWAFYNYIIFNPVKHGYVEEPGAWDALYFSP